MSPEPESWLHWKPPDNAERHAYHVVSDRLQPSAARHLPLPGAASTLSISRTSSIYITQAIPPRRLNSLPSWRVCILPVGVEIVRRGAASIIGYNADASAKERSPTLKMGPLLPIHHSTASWVNPPCFLSIELVWRAHCKLPNIRDGTQQPSTTISTSANNNASARHSPVYEVVLILPVLLLASSATRQPHRPDNERVALVHKPPDPLASRRSR